MNKPRKTVNSPLLLGVIIATLVLGLGMLMFLYLYPPARAQMMNAIGLQIALDIFCIGCSIIILIYAPRRFFSIITISKDGISRSLFGKFFKLSMKWDGIYEISYFESGMGFMMFSQTKSIKGMSYGKIAKIKDLIQLQLTKKNYDAVKQYIQQPIIGLSEEIKRRLKLE